jgi:enamine deaminase RidA (YjgF/YER057c/UK114 family)
MSQTAKRLAELGIVLPKPAAPVANYVPSIRTSGNAGAGVLPLLFVSGQVPLGPNGVLDDRHKGKLGPDSAVEEAREAARLCAINVLAQALAALGDLDKIVQTVRLGGYFNVAGAFDPLPQAMNGASDLMVEILGERGKHTRTTVGVAHLPLNALAEVEATFAVSF